VNEELPNALPPLSVGESKEMTIELPSLLNCAFVSTGSGGSALGAMTWKDSPCWLAILYSAADGPPMVTLIIYVPLVVMPVRAIDADSNADLAVKLI